MGVLILRGPAFERIFQGVFHWAHRHARRKELGHIHDAVGAGRFGGDTIEFFVIGPKLEFPVGIENAFDPGNDLARRDGAWIGDVINAEGSAPLPKFQAGAHEIAPMREGIDVLVHPGVILNFRKVIARVIELIEGDAQAPNVVAPDVLNRFFAQGFCSAVKAARERP